MYGAELNFSAVILPGVGGSLNAATAISSDKLAEMNRSGKKWGSDTKGNLVYHNENLLRANEANRKKRDSLVNRDRDSQVDGEEAMKEIFGRKRARAEAFRELKKKEYNFADDSELLSLPFNSKEGKCKGPGKCNCPSCKKAVEEENQFREWSNKKRKQLLAGEVEGGFAGPAMSFPIASSEDVSAAWSSVGRAKNPRKIMSNIIKIARKYSWEEGLPQTVKDRLDKGESGLPSPNFREWTTEERKALKQKERKGEFAGPGTSFPISSPEDVSAAWSSVGRSKDPRKTMVNIIQIAKKYGWESGLPQTVKDRLKAGESGLPN